MALNDPRTIPYAFRVVEIDGEVYLYDDSSRTYCCSATPAIFVEHLYGLTEEWAEDPYYFDPSYFDARTIERLESIPVPVDCPADMTEEEAWDAAREEARGNCLI